MRTFIAIELPEAVKDEIAATARSLSTVVKGRFLSRETYHLTLAFLGDTSEAETRRAMDALDTACAGAIEVPLQFAGLGTFGRLSDATLWLGLENAPELSALAAKLRECLQSESLTFDEKPFKPHITIARRAALPKGALPPVPFPQPSLASKVTLFKSTLSPEGAEYKPLYTVALGNAS